MAKRLIEANIEESKNTKKLLNECKNSVESKRVMIMVVYLWGSNTTETRKSLQVSSWTVEKVVRLYIANKTSFYKTNLKWRQLTDDKKELLWKISWMIIKSNKAEENIDILDVNRTINREYGMQKLDYHQTRWLVRKVLDANYQKPYVKNYKQPDNAEQILNDRLTKALIDVWSKTNTIDAEDIKNKKTKFWTFSV